MGEKVFSSFEETNFNTIAEKRKQKTAQSPESSEKSEDRDKMVVDATVAEQAIRYPTDISLLNEARKFFEQLIYELYSISCLTKKPRTYRQQARKRYLAIAKKRNPGGSIAGRESESSFSIYAVIFDISRCCSI